MKPSTLRAPARVGELVQDWEPGLDVTSILDFTLHLVTNMNLTELEEPHLDILGQ